MINILFSGNGKVFDGVLTCILSILKRTKTIEPFCIYVYTMDVTRIKPEYTPISGEMIEFLDGVAKEYNAKNQVLRVDVTDLYEQYLQNVRMKMRIVRRTHCFAFSQIWFRGCRINCYIWMWIFCSSMI